MLRFSAKMGKRKAENPASSTSTQPSSRKKGVGKGVSDIKHVYRNNEKEPQADSPSQEPQIQQEQYSLILNLAINYRYTGAFADVMDNYNWHRCSEICRSLDSDNLYYKYLHQEVCPLRQSNWMLKTLGDIADWGAAVTTGREEPFNPYEEKLSMVAKIFTHEPYDSVLKHLKNQIKLEKISFELNNRSDIKQLVLNNNSYLRNLVVKHKEIFYSNGQFSHCSVQVSSFNDRVGEIKYYMVNVVFHIQMKGKPQESHQWWISCCSPQTMEIR